MRFLVASFIYRDMGPLKDGGSLVRTPHALVTALWHKDTLTTLRDAGKLIITLMFVIANAHASQTRYHRRTSAAEDHGMDAVLRLWPGDVFNHCQRDLADRRPVYGTIGPSGYRRAVGIPPSRWSLALTPFTLASSWW